MSPISTATTGGGRFRFHWAALALLAAILTALALARARVDARVAEAMRRGLAYEDHVLAPNALPRQVAALGGRLQPHPAIYVPRIEVPARYYAAPGGYDRPLIPDPRAGRRPWASCQAGAARIPDAIAHHTDGTETLYELKCPSPWLTFSTGVPWATKMQTAFASQAVAFFVWADQAPNRSIVYGFCGWVPPWAQAILADLQTHFHRTIRIRASFMAVGFGPAQSLVGAASPGELAAGVLDLLAELAPDELTSAAYDRLKD